MVRKLVYLLFILLMMSASAQAVMTHKYTFTGNTNDSIGNADGVLMGGAAVASGNLVTSNEGDWLDLIGTNPINISQYSEVTMELWSTQYFDQSWSMTAAFGELADPGYQYIAISTSRGDNVTRSMMTDGSTNPGYQSEAGVNSAELNDGVQHHFVLTVGPLECCGDAQMISLFVDGVIRGFYNIDDRTMAGISDNFAALAKGTYTADGTWIGEIDQFNLWDSALDCDEVYDSYIAGPDVPEPATMVLLGLGSLALLRRRK